MYVLPGNDKPQLVIARRLTLHEGEEGDEAIQSLKTWLMYETYLAPVIA